MPEPQLKDITVKEVWDFQKLVFIKDPEETVYFIADDMLKPLAKAGNHFQAWCEEPTPPKKSWKILYQEKPQLVISDEASTTLDLSGLPPSREKDIHTQVAIKEVTQLIISQKLGEAFTQATKKKILQKYQAWLVTALGIEYDPEEMEKWLAERKAPKLGD